jgi:hypothetical protein
MFDSGRGSHLQLVGLTAEPGDRHRVAEYVMHPAHPVGLGCDGQFGRKETLIIAFSRPHKYAVLPESDLPPVAVTRNMFDCDS